MIPARVGAIRLVDAAGMTTMLLDVTPNLQKRTSMNRRSFCHGAILVAFLPLPAFAVPVAATLYKNPQCDCCEEYAAYLRRDGFSVDVRPTGALAEISRKAGIPEKLQGCHAMFVEGYVVGGHVPVKVIRRLLTERPAIAGVTLPGMPNGSPGMAGRKNGPFTIYAVDKNGIPPTVYAVE